MKIVKSFDDPVWFKAAYFLMTVGRFVQSWTREDGTAVPLATGFWRWGLGEDGELYCQCSHFGDANQWYPYSNLDWTLKSHISFDDMRRIVKELGHLLAFL